MEKKTLNFEVKQVKGTTFSGYASTRNLDRVGDTIEKGAFTKTLQENEIVLLYQHDTNQVIGKVLEAKEDDTGLFIKAQISETTLGKDVAILLKDSVLNKMSIGFDIVDYEKTEEGRHLKEITLHEVSIVTFPAQPNASVTSVKNFKTKNVRISGDRINEFLSLQDSFFEENPVEKDLIVTDTISTKEQQDFYDTMKEWFELKIEDVV